MSADGNGNNNSNGFPKNRIHEFRTIAEQIKPNTTILDLGCGNGCLLHFVKQSKPVKETGIEINPVKINQCVSKGVSVIQSDLDHGLKFPKKSFDTVLIVDTLQTTQSPITVLEQALKVGKKLILVFPNFAQIQVRLYLLAMGRMPKSKELPYEWHNTPNIHLFTIQDMLNLCKEKGINVHAEAYFDSGGNPLPNIFPNFFASKAMLVLSK